MTDETNPSISNEAVNNATQSNPSPEVLREEAPASENNTATSSESVSVGNENTSSVNVNVAPREQQRAPISEVIRNRKRARDAEERAKVLEERLAAIEAQIGGKEKVKQVAAKLNVAEDEAARLVDVIAEVSGNKAQPKPAVAQNNVPAEVEDFAARVQEVSTRHADWESVRPEMEALFREKEAVGANPYSLDPEDYYYLAQGRLSQKRQAEIRSNVERQVANKTTSKNLATAESASASGSKPAPPTTWTRSKINEAMRNGTYEKHRHEIVAAMSAGLIRE